MSKDKSSSTSIWDDFSEKIESLREALNTPIDENDSSVVSSEESDLIYHFADNNPVSLGTFDIEALREVLNTPIDDIIESGQLPEGSNELFENGRKDDNDPGPSDDEDIVVDQIVQSDSPGLLTEKVEEHDNTANKDSGEITGTGYEMDNVIDLDTGILQTDESVELDNTQENQEIEEVFDTKNETSIDDLINLDTQIPQTDESGELDDTRENQEIAEVTGTKNETDPDDFADQDVQSPQTDESVELDDTQENQEIAEVTGTKNETDPDDFADQDVQNSQTDESVELDNTQENQEIAEVTGTKNETDPDDFADQDVQSPQTGKTDKLENKQVSHEVEIKVQTKQSIKNEKIDNYWKQGETPNPYIQKVDESREKLNKSLEMARELVNRQTEESPKQEALKQEKKRFQFGFNRGEKNGNHKADTVKEKPSKKSNQLKPMVYEMLEPKQDNQTNQADQNRNDNQDSQAKQPNQEHKESQAKQADQTNQVKQDKGHKGKTKQSSDRVKSDEQREILNHRNRLEKSRSLGVPVFVKKPVNLEQIRQLKSMLTSQNDVRILVDTGSSQGRLLVVSGQDPDTLLNTLSHLSIVKTTTVEDETINITV